VSKELLVDEVGMEGFDQSTLHSQLVQPLRQRGESRPQLYADPTKMKTRHLRGNLLL
jgi:hypothetical protein